jgi:tol-pal system protein YbgF
MKSIQILFLITIGFFCGPLAIASAPVVDESENYANNNNYQSNDMQPLAHDDTQSSYFGDAPQAQSSNNNGDIAKLLNQIQDLQQTVQELRGQLDTQRHAMDALKDQQLTLYKDLDTRISGLQVPPKNAISKINKPESAVIPAEKTADMPEPKINVTQKTSNNPADEQISYMAAYSLVEKKQYSKAELALQDFIKNYPNSGYTPNAEYWLGELFLQDKDYSRALAHFENVVNNYPSSNKSAASMYKLGVTLVANGQVSEAKARFNEVLQKYPDSDAAQLAANQLKVL